MPGGRRRYNRRMRIEGLRKRRRGCSIEQLPGITSRCNPCISRPATELYNGAKMRDLIPRKERGVLRKLPANVRAKILEIVRMYGVKWEREHGQTVPGWVRALHIRQAIERVLDPHAGQRRAGQKSARLRREDDPEGFLLRMRNLSAIGVAARKFQRETGRRWKDGSRLDGNTASRADYRDWGVTADGRLFHWTGVIEPPRGANRSGYSGLDGI